MGKRGLSVLIGAVAVIMAAWAQTPGVAKARFVEIPGEMEFSGEMIVRPLQMDQLILKTGNASRAIRAMNRAREIVNPIALRYYPETDEYIVRVPAGKTENRLSDELMSTGVFQYAEPNWKVWPVINPNDPQFPNQWHLPKIRGPQAWDILIGNPTQIIAYTDTGIDINHPDLAPNRVPGYNAVDQIAEVNGGQVNDINGHGTHVAGIGSAVTNNATGVAGVGWNYRIMMVRVSNSSGGGSSIEILTRGARWAVENGAKTVSTSYSGVTNSAVETTGQYIRGLGCSYLWAAGNSGQSVNWPHSNVIIVGSTNINDQRSSFSNFGPFLDVMAPGEDILSTLRNNSYGLLSGTSMAAPCANGVLAMIYTRYPWFTPAEAEALLFATCVDLGAQGRDNTFGWGRVDLLGAMSTTTMVIPSSATVVYGTQSAGNLQSFVLSDDNRFEVTSKHPFAANSPSVDIVLTSTSPVQSPTKITFALEQSSSVTPVTLNTELFNYNTNSYELVDTRTGILSDTFVVVNIASNASRYVQPGTRQMRARVRMFDLFAPVVGGKARYDLARWEITP